MSSDREGDRRSVLATIGPLDLDLELSERDHDAAQAVAAGLRDAKAPNTHRAYETAWQAFQAWADAGGHRSLPATPQAVALYLGRLAAEVEGDGHHSASEDAPTAAAGRSPAGTSTSSTGAVTTATPQLPEP